MSLSESMVAQAQVALRSHGYNVSPSGKWDEDTKRAATILLSKSSVDYTKYFNTSMMSFVSHADVDTFLDELHVSENERASLLLACGIENRNDDTGIFIENKVPFVGLGQFSKATWQSVSDDPYELACDPEASLRAMLKLHRANEAVFHRQFGDGVDFTPELSYLYHNQGAGAAKSFLLTGELRWPQQSALALQTFDQAKEQFRV